MADSDRRIGIASRLARPVAAGTMVDIMSAVAPVSAPPTAYDRFTPPAAARRLCWHVLGGGRSRYVRPTGFEAFSNPGAVLMWVEAGAGTLRVGPATFQLERG